MKYCEAIFITILVFLSGVYADIGPSPSFSFSIDNFADYPDYAFYYSGNIWSNELKIVEHSTWVYKFNTKITIFAIPKNELIEEYGIVPPTIYLSADENFMRDCYPNDFFKCIKKKYLASETFNLSAGHTAFHIVNLNPDKHLLELKVSRKQPDVFYPIFAIIYYAIPVLFILAPLVLLYYFIKSAISYFTKKRSAGKKE